MRLIKSLFARTKYLHTSRINEAIFKSKCRKNKKIAHMHPEYYNSVGNKVFFELRGCLFNCTVDILKKIMFVACFVWLPYQLIAIFMPDVGFKYERTLMYFYFVLCVVTGAITNAQLFSTSKQEKMFAQYLELRPYFFNRLFSGMIQMWISNVIALIIFRVSIVNALAIAGLAVMCRPLGEWITYCLHAYSAYFSRNFNSVMGVLMAISVIVAYVIPVLSRSVSKVWDGVTGLVPMIIGAVIFLLGCFLYFTINFKRVMRYKN